MVDALSFTEAEARIIEEMKPYISGEFTVANIKRVKLADIFFDETGDKIRQIGHEYGAVTGRERRCGWIDLVALKYAIMINGVTQLIMMKSDVLDGFETVKACVAYNIDGKETTEFPFEINDTIQPVYVEMPGWNVDMTKMQSEDEFPEEFNAYIAFLEEELEVPIKIVSVGPDRAQTIVRYTEE